jgi:hypothetical protein
MFVKDIMRHWYQAPHGSFKDYFIPHQGNGYKPHSLHPKRIAFHAASLVAIKAMVVLLAIIFPLSAWMSPDLAVAQGKKIIALTNEVRKSLDVPILLENKKLDEAAAAKAQDMLLKEYFAHISPENKGLDYFLGNVNYKYAVAGENLAIGFATPEEVIAAWKNSPTHYANMIDPDFLEIGVGMDEGSYKGADTTLVAQYFGTRDNSSVEVAMALKPSTPTIKPSSTEKKSVLSYKETISPVTDVKDTKVSIVKTPDKKTQAVQVRVYLDQTTQKAVATVGNTTVVLQPDPSEPKKWTGETVTPVPQSTPITPIAPATITATNTSGLTTVTDIDQSNIIPKQVTPLEQYFFFKNNPNKALQTIFDISSLYFKIVLLLAIISLLLNIFIEIRKQHPHLIASGAGLIALLVIFIAF